MEDDWEQIADTKAPVVIPPKNPNLNKWEGEDEEDDVKDSWEDEDELEEKKDEEKAETPVIKPKKTLQQRIAEKEKFKLEEAERLQKEKEAEDMTPEQKLAEKLRLQKIQEENDLKTALETLGITPTNLAGIDAMNPTTAEEFTEFADALSKKISSFKHDPEYTNFLDELVLKIFASLPSNNIRKVKTTLDNLFLEKQKIEKGDKPKKPKGGKVKARLRVEGEATAKFEDYKKYDDYDEYDDFM